VDAAGDVYLTGVAGAGYPYTVTPPAIPFGAPFVISALPFLSRLDPTGQTLLFSVPVGGAGVQVDSAGNVYVGGGVGGSILGYYEVTVGLPVLASVPKPCLPNNLTIHPGRSLADAGASETRISNPRRALTT
jgi:hypothetical protein